ncbi:MAG: hypothetical protein AB7V42_03250 [Thermoleophilia bacterium]
MSPPRVAPPASRLAERVAWLGDEAWSAELAALSGDGERPRPVGEPPTFHEIATDGIAVVDALAEAGRWDEAAAHARRLRAFFGGQRATLSPVAGQAFDGVLAAVLARDAQELADFGELLGELFPRPERA